MGEVIPFRRPTAKQKHRGKTLCLNNLHRWKIVTNKKFDVKLGRLVTVLKCERCGKEKMELR